MSMWNLFTRENRDLWLAADIPIEVVSNQRAFDYILMHGTHPKCPYFGVGELTHDAQVALRELAARYLAVFYDPGLGMLAPIDHEQIRARAAELRYIG